MASVDWDDYRAVNGELESRACYNTSMTSAYDIDKLLAKWDLVLQSKCLVKANSKPELIALSLEEQYKERKNHNTDLKNSLSNYSLPVVGKTVNDLVIEGVISDIVDSNTVEYHLLYIEWNLDIISAWSSDVEGALLTLLQHEISLYYRECAAYGPIKLPLAPMIKYDDFDVIGGNYSSKSKSFEIKILKPVKRA